MGTSLEIRNPVVVVGIGGAGIKIALAASSLLGCNCVLISNDKRDLKTDNERCKSILVDTGTWVNPSSYKLRYFTQACVHKVASELNGFSTVIVVSNLAGKAGIAMAPVICRTARESATVISVVIMPFGFQKERIFHAGISLRRIREASHAAIVMDNDALLDNNPNLAVEECYRISNRALVEIISYISSPESSIISDMNVLVTSDDQSSAEESLRDSIAMLYQEMPNADSIKRTLLYVVGGSKIPVGQLSSLFNALQSIFRGGNEESSAEIAMSISSSFSVKDGARVHLLACVPQKTRFDRYDPIAEIIPADNVLDWDELDSSPDLNFNIPVPNIE